MLSKPDAATATEKSSAVVDCDLFPFPAGMNPNEDAFMTEYDEAEAIVDGALS